MGGGKSEGTSEVGFGQINVKAEASLANQQGRFDTSDHVKPGECELLRGSSSGQFGGGSSYRTQSLPGCASGTLCLAPTCS